MFGQWKEDKGWSALRLTTRRRWRGTRPSVALYASARPSPSSPPCPSSTSPSSCTSPLRGRWRAGSGRLLSCAPRWRARRLITTWSSASEDNIILNTAYFQNIQRLKTKTYLYSFHLAHLLKSRMFMTVYFLFSGAQAARSGASRRAAAAVTTSTSASDRMGPTWPGRTARRSPLQPAQGLRSSPRTEGTAPRTTSVARWTKCSSVRREHVGI